MSLAVTSFWKSTKALRAARLGVGRQQAARLEAGRLARSAREGARRAEPRRRGLRRRAQPSARQAASSKVPLAGAGRALAPAPTAPGTKASIVGIEAQLAARLREQMHGRRPAARHADAVAGEIAPARRRDPRRRPAPTIRPADALAAASSRRSVCPARTSHAGRARRRGLGAAIGRGPQIDDRATSTPAPCRSSAAAIGAVVVGRRRPRAARRARRSG